MPTRMNQSDIIVTGDNVAERGKSFLNALDPDGVRKRITNVLEFLIGCRAIGGKIS